MTALHKSNAGSATPLGPDVRDGGINFALFSANATAITLCLFSDDGRTETEHIQLTARTGDIWHIFVKGLKAGQLYGYRVDGPYAPHDGHRFNAHKLLIDPYAKGLSDDFTLHDSLFGYDLNDPQKDLSFSTLDSAPHIPKSIAGLKPYKGGPFKRPDTPLADTVIYEAHIKGLTKCRKDTPSAHRGTLSGLAKPDVINHLKELGVTALELLPAQSFFSEPRLTRMGLTNYWGYNPVNYFAPHRPYLGPDGTHSFQKAVKALHKAGIEVILDVVYNHTGESWELGPTLSYRGIDNASYYHLQDNKRFYVNHTGTGNTLNLTHPQVLELTLSSLRYWVEEMGVDGFRFDLGPILGRNPHDFDPSAPFFTAVQNDPVLSRVKLIAEPWDIGPGGYVLGQFPKGWSEWNDKYRDDVRRFWRGDDNAHQNLAGRLLGSADIFDHSEKSAQSSVNFITAHDGFNLHDTVSFNHKHNLANGEDNRDGHGHNLSDNMGIEGPTNDDSIIQARRQRKKNLLATLFLSQGTPMILAGDEFGHSQGGNNNAYCQDNEITWLNWDNYDADLKRFTKELIALRKRYPHFSQSEFLHGDTIADTPLKNVEWINARGQSLHPQDWENAHLKALGLVLTISKEGSVIIAINRGDNCDFDFDGGEMKQVFTTAPSDMPEATLPAQSVTVFHSKTPYVPKDRRVAVWGQLSDRYGILSEYRTINGERRVTTVETQQALLKAMGPESEIANIDLYLAFAEAPISARPNSTLPKAIYGAEILRDSGGVWGVTAALYGLKSDRNWGIGDFEDLAQFAEVMATRGADFIGINPVHALFPSAPHLYAPYSPSSRNFLNVMHIAPDKIADLPADFHVDLNAARQAEHVDYKKVYGLKMKAFEAAFTAFSTLPKTAPRYKAFSDFKARKGESLDKHALFDVLFETLPLKKKTYDGWKNFPKKYHNATSQACLTFSETHQDRIEFYKYLQWVAECQLKEAQSRAVAAGMSIGLYLDFAVGVVPGGADVWQRPEAFAQDVSLGAPGDAANPDGQKWNLSPFKPHYLKANNYEPYRKTLNSVMSLCGAVRIDHILGHLRSFWISEGQNGAYVHYPFDGLLTMIAELSQAQSCVVFGEDLGTVPDGFRDRMATYDLMGCNIAFIERDSHGNIIPPEHIRPLSITAFSNHDFPTMTGFWTGEDFKWREALGIGDDPSVLEWEKGQREADKTTFLHHVKETEPHMSATLMAKLQSYLAKSDALAFAVQLDDLLLEPLQANVPGTTDQQPNWRRRSRLSLSEIEKNSDVGLILSAIHMARGK